MNDPMYVMLLTFPTKERKMDWEREMNALRRSADELFLLPDRPQPGATNILRWLLSLDNIIRSYGVDTVPPDIRSVTEKLQCELELPESHRHFPGYTGRRSLDCSRYREENPTFFKEGTIFRQVFVSEDPCYFMNLTFSSEEEMTTWNCERRALLEETYELFGKLPKERPDPSDQDKRSWFASVKRFLETYGEDKVPPDIKSFAAKLEYGHWKIPDEDCIFYLKMGVVGNLYFDCLEYHRKNPMVYPEEEYNDENK